MEIIEKLYTWYGKRNVRVVFFVLMGLLVAVVMKGGGAESVTEPTTTLPVVSVATASELAGAQSLQLIGTVRSVNEATIDSEVSGRVTGVSVSLGDTVFAGQIIARLENTTQYASLLQAEGSYEAAQAAAAQSDISVTEAANAKQTALNNAISAQRAAYTTVNGVLLNTVDDTFRNLEDHKPSFSLIGGINNDEIVNLRATLRDDMRTWSQLVSGLTTEQNLDSAQAASLAYTLKVANLVDLIYGRSIALSNVEKTTLSGASIDSYKASLTSARAQLDSVDGSLKGTYTQLQSANESYNRAVISGTGGSVSSANAQLKQALGTLKNAQANYQKTLLRSPISGVIQELNVQQGDFVASFQTVAKVTGEGSLEVTAFVGDTDKSVIEVGQIVGVGNGVEGVVTHIAPAIDSVTKKTEVRIGVAADSLTNGDTVRITLTQESISTEVVIPLAAVKLTAENAAVFMVVDGVLVAKTVTLGEIRGSSVVIESGLTRDEFIVDDVRGFASGQQVAVTE